MLAATKPYSPSFTMVYRPISADMKRTALQLLNKDWEMQQIANLLGISSKSIHRWQDNYETHSLVNPPSYLQGRQCILSSYVVDDLYDLMLESPELYLDEIGIWLALYHEVQILTMALHDNLRELGLTHKLMHYVAAEQDHKLCANWMYDFLTMYTAEQMVVLDESSKDNRTLIRRYGHALCGNEPILTVSLDRGVCYSILLALTFNGYLAVQAVKGSIDGEEFF